MPEGGLWRWTWNKIHEPWLLRWYQWKVPEEMREMAADGGVMQLG